MPDVAHHYNEYPPLLFERVAVSTAVLAYYCCLRLVVFQPQHFAGVLQLASVAATSPFSLRP